MATIAYFTALCGMHFTQRILIAVRKILSALACILKLRKHLGDADGRVETLDHGDDVVVPEVVGLLLVHLVRRAVGRELVGIAADGGVRRKLRNLSCGEVGGYLHIATGEGEIAEIYSAARLARNLPTLLFAGITCVAN